MGAQQYEELFVATACVAYGVLLLWAPGAIPAPARRTRGWGIAALAVGALMAVAAVVGR
jgi:hypothetical protein